MAYFFIVRMHLSSMRRELEWDKVSLFQPPGTYYMIQQIISDYLLCAKYCTGQWESTSEQSQFG